MRTSASIYVGPCAGSCSYAAERGQSSFHVESRRDPQPSETLVCPEVVWPEDARRPLSLLRTSAVLRSRQLGGPVRWLGADALRRRSYHLAQSQHFVGTA